jgi:hypothetical protein
VQLTRAEIKKVSPQGHGSGNKNGSMLADWRAFGGFFNLRQGEGAGQLGRIGHGGAGLTAPPSWFDADDEEEAA